MVDEPIPANLNDQTRAELQRAMDNDDSAEELLREAYQWITPGQDFEQSLTTRITIEMESMKGLKVVDEDIGRRKRQMKIAAAALAILVILVTVFLFLIFMP